MKVVGWLLLLIVVPLGSMFIWLASAKWEVDKFCDQVKIGEVVNDVKSRAMSDRFELKEYPSYEYDGKVFPEKLIVIRKAALARYMCEVSHENGKVLKKERSMLD